MKMDKKRFLGPVIAILVLILMISTFYNAYKSIVTNIEEIDTIVIYAEKEPGIWLVFEDITDFQHVNPMEDIADEYYLFVCNGEEITIQSGLSHIEIKDRIAYISFRNEVTYNPNSSWFKIRGT